MPTEANVQRITNLRRAKLLRRSSEASVRPGVLFPAGGLARGFDARLTRGVAAAQRLLPTRW
jgi:hypothetical protein